LLSKVTLTNEQMVDALQQRRGAIIGRNRLISWAETRICPSIRAQGFLDIDVLSKWLSGFSGIKIY
jgi:hypothetical protein